VRGAADGAREGTADETPAPWDCTSDARSPR